MIKWRSSVPPLSVYDVYYELLHDSKSCLMKRKDTLYICQQKRENNMSRIAIDVMLHNGMANRYGISKYGNFFESGLME